jgi:hypothetical protein
MAFLNLIRFKLNSAKFSISEHRGRRKKGQTNVDPKGEAAGAKDSKNATRCLGSTDLLTARRDANRKNASQGPRPIPCHMLTFLGFII